MIQIPPRFSVYLVDEKTAPQTLHVQSYDTTGMTLWKVYDAQRLAAVFFKLFFKLKQ